MFHSYKALYYIFILITILFTPIYSLIINIYYVGTHVACAALEMEDTKMSKSNQKKWTKSVYLHMVDFNTQCGVKIGRIGKQKMEIKKIALI